MVLRGLDVRLWRRVAVQHPADRALRLFFVIDIACLVAHSHLVEAIQTIETQDRGALLTRLYASSFMLVVLEPRGGTCAGCPQPQSRPTTSASPCQPPEYPSTHRIVNGAPRYPSLDYTAKYVGHSSRDGWMQSQYYLSAGPQALAQTLHTHILLPSQVLSR